MGADNQFKLLDMCNPRHIAITDLLAFAGSANQAIHGTSLSAYTFVHKAGVDAVQELLANQATAAPLLDEWMRSGSMGCRGITVADEHDFPPHMGEKLVGAAMYRQFNVPGKHCSSLPLLAMAFLPNGGMLTVNEPHGEDRINFFDGVRDAQ